MSAVEVVLERLAARGCHPQRNGAGWSARCPAHDDQHPSLAVGEGDDGLALLNCHAGDGCTTEQITGALDLTMRDLFPEKRTSPPGEIVDTYDYTDERGALLYQVVRKTGKRFVQRRPDGEGGWVWKLGNRRRVLYRLPQVLEAAARGDEVLVVEGEKDVHAAEHAGVVATTNPGGAGKWRPEYSKTLAGAIVFVVADADAPGRAHAWKVADTLAGVAAAVGVVEPISGKDLTDHLAAGHSIDDLRLLDTPPDSDEAELEEPPAPPPPDDDVASITQPAPSPDEPELDESWARVDLGPALAGEHDRITPTLLRREDDAGLITAGRVNGIHGDSGEGKSWVAAIAAAQELDAGHHVVWVDFEDPDPMTLVGRLRDVIGADADRIRAQLHYFGPLEPFDGLAVDAIVYEAESSAATLVVIDSLGEAFSLEGLDENKDVDVAPWMRRVARAIAIADAGPAVLVVDHSTKAADNPLHPSGSKRKRAAITGQSYLVEATVPLTSEKGGRLRLRCAKDRHGHYRRGATTATIDFTTYPDGGTTIHVRPPDEAEKADAPDARLERIARAAVDAARDADGPVSQRVLIATMDVKASATTKRAGIEIAIARGAIRTEEGPRRQLFHIYVRGLGTTPDDDPTQDES